jgi:ABC-type multidrug transport system fused ATPase/permease subunit
MVKRDGLRAARLIIALTFKADPWRAFWLIIRSPISMCTSLGTAYGLKNLTNAALALSWPRVVEAAVLLVAVQLAGSVFGSASLPTRAMVIEKTSLLIDCRLMEAALAVPGLEHHETPKHRDQLELLRLRRGELGEVVDGVSHNLGILLLAVGSVGLLAQISPWLLLLPLAGLPPLWLTPRAERVRVRAQEKSAETLRSSRHIFELATRAAAGKEIRLFGLGDTLRGRHRTLWDDANRAQNRAAWLAFLLTGLGYQFFALAYVIAIGYVVYLAVHGQASPGQVLMAVQLASGFNRLVLGIVYLAGWLYGQIRIAGWVVWLMDYAKVSAKPASDPASVPAKLRKGITFEDVTFRYPDTEADVIRNLSVHIPAGSTVAIVGENGAGKSTLVKLLGRFYEPTCGRILVDGIDQRRFDPAEWRSRWAAGFQDFARFELLAGETVGVGDLPQIGEEAAICAALARAAATDVMDSLPEGTSTRLGRTFDDGVELSGGQWQKLALGRAMMRTTPLVLALDEPTASLDAMTEHELFTRYAARADQAAAESGAITVLVSHRFSTVRMADLVIVIDSGRLVECGSHEELIAHRGLYFELYEMQARAYR